MTRTGVFIRCAVCLKTLFHCAAESLSTSPEISAATNTPVPAADNQLMVKRAASGFAFSGATGGMRCTRLCRAGMSHTGSESVPANGEPRSVVLNFTPEKRLFRKALNSGMPQSAQQRMRMIHGVHARSVSPTPYLYFHSWESVVAGARPLCSPSRSERSRNRVFGCQTKRMKSAVHTTEKTPDTTSVIRWNSFVPDAYHCMIANEPPATSVAGHTSNACFQVPPSIFTNVATNQNGTRIETNGNWRPAIAESVTWSRPLTAASVTIGVPIAPQATGAVFARRFNTADWNGRKPRPTITAPAIATGVPKPEVPSIMAPNEKAMSTACRRRSNEM